MGTIVAKRPEGLKLALLTKALKKSLLLRWSNPIAMKEEAESAPNA